MYYVIQITHLTIGEVKERPELIQREFFCQKQAKKYFEKVCDKTSRDLNKYLGCTREVSKENYKKFDVKFNLGDEEIKITSEIFKYKQKIHKGWINVVNLSRATMILGTPGSGVEPGVKKKVSDAIELSNFEYAMLRYVQEGANAKDDEELIELTKKYSKELHKYT